SIPFTRSSFHLVLRLPIARLQYHSTPSICRRRNKEQDRDGTRALPRRYPAARAHQARGAFAAGGRRDGGLRLDRLGFLLWSARSGLPPVEHGLRRARPL